MYPRRAAVAITTALLISAAHAQAQSTESNCESQPQADRAVVYGAVQDSVTRLPVQELKVTLSWQEENGRRRTQEQRTGRDGVFRFCDAPVNRLVRVEAEQGARAAQSVTLAAGRAERVDMIVNAAKTAVGGRVVEHGTNRGISAAEVRVRGSDVYAASGNDGSFDLRALPPGIHVLEVTHVAFQGRQDSLRVTTDARLQLTIELAATVIALRPIMVVMKSQYLQRNGFYDRDERGLGTHLSREDWEERLPRFATDVLRTIAGVRVIPRTNGVGYAVLDRGNCSFRYILDGTRVGPTFELDDIPIEMIEGIEIYRGTSQIPPQFMFPPSSARANCGVIVIWTRNR